MFRLSREDCFLYILLEDYQEAESPEEKQKIFRSFCDKIWECDNDIRKYKKEIKFTVLDQYLETEIGKIFDTWSNLPFMWYKTHFKRDDESKYEFQYYIRQRINNIYFLFFDTDIVANKNYLKNLKIPKQLYYSWINGTEFTPEELTEKIDKAMNRANHYKKINVNSKIKMNWTQYKSLMEGFLLKCFDNYDKEKSENIRFDVRIPEYWQVDNVIIKYFCKSIYGYVQNYQVEYFGLPRNKQYGFCDKCGKLFVKNDYRKLLCPDCLSTEGDNPYYFPIKIKKITCCDCGKEFEVDARGYKKVRCSECQKIVDRNRKRLWKQNK